jgi:hypothetical protein
MSAGGAVASQAAPRSSASFVALYRLVLRMQVTVFRVVGICALGAIAVPLGLLARANDEPVRAATEIVIGYGLGLVLPLAALWLATACIGDLVDDHLLVYVWLKPVARWQLPVAAILAAATVVLPLVAVPLVVAVVVAGAGELLGSVVVAALLSVLAYAGSFVAVSLWLRRALWWGLLYVLVWENGLARAVDGAARLSIASYAQSLVARAADLDISYADRSAAASIVVPVVVATVGAVLATTRYRRAEID